MSQVKTGKIMLYKRKWDTAKEHRSKEPRVHCPSVSPVPEADARLRLTYPNLLESREKSVCRALGTVLRMSRGVSKLTSHAYFPSYLLLL